MKRIIIPILALFTVLSACDNRSSESGVTADMALINGEIHTMDADGTIATAIGIKNDEIVYVGDASEMENLIGTETNVIDLEGGMVLPGFVEGHIHPAAGGLLAAGVDLQTDDMDELFERIRNEVETNDADTILGWGLRLTMGPDGWPKAAMLDEIESDRPIFFWAIDGHKAWVNSRALEMAGIDKDTPDMVPGYSFFQRDEEGNPLGWVVELPAMMKVLGAVVDITPEYIEAGMQRWFPRFSAAGITTVHDHGILGMGEQDGFEMLMQFEKDGRMPIRLSGVHYWNDPTVDPLVPLTELRERFNGELVKAEYLKINLDGGDDAWNALYVDPYVDKPEIKAEPIIPVDVLNDVIQRADAQGINVTCHCWGDLAVRHLLDAVENAINVNPPRDRRHKITHATLVHPDDFGRFKELGVTYDSTGAWMTYDLWQSQLTELRLGRERAARQFPIRAIAETGANVSLGSDWPAANYLAEYRPLVSIEMAVTRQGVGRKDVPPLGGEAMQLPLETALRANTINAAYGMNMDDEIGSLEAGKKADIVVLQENLYEIDPTSISEVKVLYTIMGGTLTYDHSSN